MRILDLPLEIFHDIIARAIDARGMRRGLRLRLVNKTFAKQVVQSIFVFQILDAYFEFGPLAKEAVLPSFAPAYLERRVLNEPIGGLRNLRFILRVAERLQEATTDGRNVHDYVRQLCHLVVITCGSKITSFWRADQACDESSLENNVFVAAMYTKTIPVVEKWLTTGKHGLVGSDLFGLAHEHAARHGDRILLAPMLVHSYKDELQFLRTQLLAAVARVGHADDMPFVFEYEAEQNPWEFSRDKQKRPSYPRRNEYSLATMATPSMEIFRFITEKRRIHCTDREFGVKEYTTFLVQCAHKGWADMAACYLELGASVNGFAASAYDDEPQRPLIDGCKYGHEGIVKALLAHGADTSRPALEVAAQNGHLSIVRLLLEHKAEHGEALSKAAAKGYGDIVEELLNAGVVLENGSHSLLQHAIEHEHVIMFRLLVERGCDVKDPDTVAVCVKVAQEKGLDSMLELLREAGMEIDTF